MSKLSQTDRNQRREAATARSKTGISPLAADDILRGPRGLALAEEFYETNIPFIRAICQGREDLIHRTFLRFVETGAILVTRSGDDLHAELEPAFAAKIRESKARLAALDAPATDDSAG